MLSLYMTILIVGLMSSVYMETCPEEDISPCKCEEHVNDQIKVNCARWSYVMHDLQELQKALTSLSGKNKVFLRLHNFIINKQLSNLLSGIKIRTLEFHDCRLDTLTKDDKPGDIDLATLQNDLEALRFSNCSDVPTKFNFVHLKKLRALFLWINNMTELRDDWLSNGPSSLEDLYLFGSNIKKIGSNAFSQQNNLDTLMLEDNRFGPIQRQMFPTSADKLRVISLQNNALTSLPVDIFSGMSSLKRLHLGANRFTTLDERTWSPIWHQLEYVDLSDNNIVCDDRLNWIIKTKERPELLGRCNNPNEFRGMKLEEFFRSRIQGNVSEVFT